MDKKITPILLPKWGMDMENGKIGEWLVSEGEQVTAGAEVLEIESEKVTNVLETSTCGVLRRQLVSHGDTYPVGTLLGVIALGDVPDDEIADFIAAYSSSDIMSEALDTPAINLTDEIVQIDGPSLHYTSAGEGDVTLVLIHGFGGNLSSWGGLQMALASSYRVVSIELPGHGTSSKQIGGGGSQDFARLLIALLDKLGIGDVHLLGHSLGGAVAAQIATLAPERVKSITLISNYGTGTKVDIDYIEEFLAASRRKPVKTALKRLFVDGNSVNTDMIESVLRLKRMEGVDLALRTIADQVKAEQPVQAIVDLPKLPTQIIIGREDNIIDFDDDLLASTENLSIIDGAAHMPQLEQPVQVTRLIKDFLAKIQDTKLR